MTNNTFLFVHYEGPKLSQGQKDAVRSQAMYSVRSHQRRAGSRVSPTTLDRANHAEEAARTVGPVCARPKHYQGDNGCISSQVSGGAAHCLRELDQPSRYPQTTTGIDAKIHAEYIYRIRICSDFIDEGFQLVPFRKRNFYYPEPNKRPCVYLGWLLASAMIDAYRGEVEMSYPFFEMHSAHELGIMIKKQRSGSVNTDIIVATQILGLVEMLRFGPHSAAHMDALKNLVQLKGGIDRIEVQAIQASIKMSDLLYATCYNRPLSFSTVGKPVLRYCNPRDSETNCFTGSPLLLCGDGRFSSLSAEYSHHPNASKLTLIIEWASVAIQECYRRTQKSAVSDAPPEWIKFADHVVSELDALADINVCPGDVTDCMVQACALGSRILYRALERSVEFRDAANHRDVRELNSILRFIGLRPWTDMPYVYLWLIVMGIASSTARERPFFVVELMRSAFSYGCHQFDLFSVFLRNFIYLRQTICSTAQQEQRPSEGQASS